MHRLGRIAVRVVLWTVVGIVGLLLGVVTALQFKPVRGFVRDHALAAVRGSLRGDLYFDDLRWPSLEHIELSGISLHDRNGLPVLTLPSLIIRVRLHELIRGRVQIDRIDLDHPYIDLADLGDEAGLLSVFGSDKPKPPKPSPSDADFSPIAVNINALCIAGGQIAVQPDDQRHLMLRRVDTCARLALGRDLSITLSELRAELLNRDKTVLELVPRKTLPAFDEASTAGNDDRVARVGLDGRLSIRDTFAFDGYVQLRQFGKESLDALAVDSSWLHAPLQLDAHAHSAGRDTLFHVDTRSGGSSARLQGGWSERKLLTVLLESERLRLQDFSDSQLEPISFKLDAKADLSAPEKMALQAKLEHAHLGEAALPIVELHATRTQSGIVELASLEAKQASARLTARGRLEPNGDTRVQVDIAIPQLSDVPALKALVEGLSGALTGKVEFARAHSGDIVADVNLASRHLQLKNNGAAALDLALHANGSPTQPVLKAQLRGQQLALGQQRIREAYISLGGGPDRYDLRGRADDRELQLDGWLAAEPPGWSAGFDLRAKIAEEPLHASLRRALFVPGQQLLVDELRADYMGARVFADGQVGLGDRNTESSLRFGASVPQLASITSTLMQTTLPGRIEVVGDAKGSIDKPKVTTRVRWLNGPALAKHESEVSLYANADLASARIHANIQAQAGSAHVVAKLESHWRENLPLADAFSRARHDLTVNARGLAIEALASSSGKPAPIGLRGLLGGQLEAHGNAKALEVATRWQADLRAGRDPNGLAIELNGHYADAKLKLELTANDMQGRLLDFDYSQQVNVEQLLVASKPPAQLIDQTHWDAHAKFAKRRVRDLPLVRGLGLDRDLAPLTIASSTEVVHQPGQEPTGEWKTELRWEPGPDGAATLAPCSAQARGDATFTAKLADGQVKLAVTSRNGVHETARMETGLHVRLSDALVGRTDRIGPTILTTKLNDFELGQIPLLCERGRGVVTAQLTGKDLFADLAEFDVKLEAKHLQWDESPPLDVRANAHSESDHLAVRARLQTGKGELRIDGALPVGFRTHDPFAMVNRAGPVALSTHWQKVEVAALLAYVPAVARSSGKLHGTIDVAGPLQSPNAHGQLQFEDVSFTLPRLGQRFSHLTMNASLDNRNLRLANGKFRDLDGSATIAAQLELADLNAWTAELNFNVRNFPVRKSGVMLGRADADINLIAKTTTAATDVRVKLDNVDISLTTSDLGDVQSLDRDPEIQFTDALAVHTSRPDPPDDSEPARPTAPAQISIESSSPLWIRRDDFAVQMNTRLKVVLGSGPPDMTGSIDLIRGYISLLGTSFDVKRGRVTFTGGERVDPELEITAEHQATNGSKIALEVTGFVQAPKLAFELDGQAVTAGEAIAAISGRGDASGGSKGAEEQLASAAIGMTTGLLSLGARREFGDWVPMLSVEQGDQTKVRVGIEADKLIPKFMHGFVRGAYVEGIVASGSSNNGSGNANVGAETNTSSGSGVLLELMLPKSFVWAGQYGPGDAWSLDMDWRP